MLKSIEAIDPDVVDCYRGLAQYIGDDTHLDLKEKGIRYRDFMNKEFKQCAMLDGLKPRERKILLYAQELKIALMKLENKVKFVHEVWNGALDLSKSKSEMCVELKKKGFKSFPSIGLGARKNPREEEDVAVKGYAGYDYLLSNPILDDNDMEELEKGRKQMTKELLDLTNSSAESLWEKDLVALDKELAFEKYPKVIYKEAEKKARAKRAPDAATGQSMNKKRCILRATPIR